MEKKLPGLFFKIYGSCVSESSHTVQLEKDWKNLSPKDRVIMFERLLKYSLPALSSIDRRFQFENMTEEQLDKIIKELQIKASES